MDQQRLKDFYIKFIEAAAGPCVTETDTTPCFTPTDHFTSLCHNDLSSPLNSWFASV